MPKGLPTLEDLHAGRVAGFSLDTCIIQSAGFKFDEAALGTLRSKLPEFMRLYISEVVRREVVGHFMDDIARNHGAFISALSGFGRKLKLSFAEVVAKYETLNVLVAAEAEFLGRVEQYVDLFDGEILSFDDVDLGQKMLELYFLKQPPFGEGKNKSEFPDAAALIAFEAEAERLDKQIILVSDDRAWADFSVRSKLLYCVPSLEVLTELFVGYIPPPERFEKIIHAALEDPASELRLFVAHEVATMIQNWDWDISLITGISGRVDGGISDAALDGSVSIEAEGLKVWNSDADNSYFAVEVRITASARFFGEATLYVRDPVDRDEVSLVSKEINLTADVEGTAYLTFQAAADNDDPMGWSPTVSVDDLVADLPDEYEINPWDYD